MRIEDLAGTTIGAAVSGGLDSCTITRWLVEEGVGVVALTADLGQPDEDDINDVAERMRVAGAKEALIADAREALARAGLEVIQAQAKYEGGYWNTTGIARYATVAAILPELTERGLTVLSHGATGAGQRPGSVSACDQHAGARRAGVRPLARSDVPGAVPGTTRNDRVLRARGNSDPGDARQAIFHRRQPAGA